MSTTLTVKGQVTVPENIRDYLPLAPGDRIDFAFAADGTVHLVPLRARCPARKAGRFDALVGLRSKAGATDEWMDLLRGYPDDKDDPGFR